MGAGSTGESSTQTGTCGKGEDLGSNAVTEGGVTTLMISGDGLFLMTELGMPATGGVLSVGGVSDGV